MVECWNIGYLVHAATEAIQPWAWEIRGMRMGILIVIHTFGADMKWHPHIHLVVTGGGLSLDGKGWVSTNPKFLMHHGGLKKRWQYHDCHQGVVIPGTDKHIHGEIVKIDPKTLDPNTEVMRF